MIMATGWNSKDRRYRWLYRIDTNGNRIGEIPVGKMYLDTIIIDFAELVAEEKRHDEDAPWAETAYWQGQNPDDLMYGFEAIGPIIPEKSGLPSLWEQNQAWTDALQEIKEETALGAAPKEVSKEGFLKNTGHSSGDNYQIFIKLPPAPSLDFYFHYPQRGGEFHPNKLKLLTYYMDPRKVGAFMGGDANGVQIYLEPTANRAWKNNYGSLVRLWATSLDRFFDSINVEDISR